MYKNCWSRRLPARVAVGVFALASFSAVPAGAVSPIFEDWDLHANPGVSLERFEQTGSLTGNPVATSTEQVPPDNPGEPQHVSAEVGSYEPAPARSPSVDDQPADPLLDARGFNRYRDSQSLLPWEHVDPFTGNLLLTFTDLELPGNAGFNLRIQRTYNSKIFADYYWYFLNEDSWAGIGWTLHLGRVLEPGWVASRAIIEMPDGSSHPVYSLTGPQDTMTRDYWRYDSSQNPPVLTLPNGVRYWFGHVGNTGPGGRVWRYVTKIEDPFGNRIDVEYMSDTDPSAPLDGINHIHQRVGGDTRTISFGYESSTLRKNLSWMRLEGTSLGISSWYYDQVPPTNHPNATGSLLVGVRPPEGPPWGFDYQTTTVPYYELEAVTTPNGATISYTYGWSFYQYCSVNVFSANLWQDTRVLATRTAVGPGVPSGQWTFLYRQGPRKDQTVVNTPCGSVKYTFYGIGGDPPNATCSRVNNVPIFYYWKAGAQEHKEILDNATVVESEERTYRISAILSYDNEPVGPYLAVGIHNPLVENRTVNRGGC